MGLAPGFWQHSGNLAIQIDEWGPTQEPGVPSSNPAAPESLFGDLDPITELCEEDFLFTK